VKMDLSRREIGSVKGDRPGPTLVAVAGVHGNEPAGLEAGARLLAALEAEGVPLAGELVVLAGNVQALRAGRRYVDKDLNRQWTDVRIAELVASHPDGDDAEDREQRELLAALDAVAARARGPLHLADLHTSSAPGIPFVMLGDTPAQRRFIRAFRVPVILRLEQLLDGVLSRCWARRGWTTFAVEGGQHADPAAVDSLEAILWQTLAEGGLVDPATPRVTRAGELLEDRRAGLPRVLEVLRRRSISADDRFVMEPGFRNIDRAQRGQLLARDIAGEVRAPDDGVVILPLYQGQGNDGYFWGRVVEPGSIQPPLDA
jgi:predicted deacylase